MNGQFVIAFCVLVASIASAQQAPLELENKIPLGDVRGRIDHLAFDAKHQRLFVAELGNGTVGVVDLKSKKLIRRLTGLDEPQGLAYFEQTDTLYAASGGDGSLHLFTGQDLTPSTIIKLGSDADNVRVDRTKQQIIVGYGSGALAVIDAATRKVVATIPLKAHPESFQLNASGSRIYVNVPSAREIAVIDRSTSKQIASWSTNELSSNYPLALDESKQTALAVFRRPPQLAVFRAADGQRLGTVGICGDSDDAFVDAKRQRVYVTCGEGFVDVLTANDSSYQHSARLKTVSGARTSLWVAELDRLYVAVRARGDEPVAIWVYHATSE